MKKPVLYFNHAVFIVTTGSDGTVTMIEAQSGYPVNQIQGASF